MQLINSLFFIYACCLFLRAYTYRIVQLSDFFNADIGYFGGDWGIDGSDPKVEASLKKFLSIIKAENPDFVIVTGDIIGGRWWGGTDKSKQQNIFPFGPNNRDLDVYKSFAENAAAVYYPAWFQRFEDAGLTVHVCPGDHEYGDRPEQWVKTSADGIVNAASKYQIEIFAQYQAEYLPPVQVERPVSTRFENTSYSFIHKGTQFILLDQFDYRYAKTAMKADFGKFYLTVRGAYLDWVENQLRLAAGNPAINRIVVVGHSPILSYDLARYSSELHYRDVPGENGENSILWSLFTKYNVDLYMAGEIHGENIHTCKNVVQTIYNGYAPYAQFFSYGVFDITEDRIGIISKKVDQSVVDVNYWSPSEGTMTKFHVVNGTAVELPEFRATIKGNGGCKEFENIKYSRECDPAARYNCTQTKSTNFVKEKPVLEVVDATEQIDVIVDELLVEAVDEVESTDAVEEEQRLNSVDEAKSIDIVEDKSTEVDVDEAQQDGEYEQQWTIHTLYDQIVRRRRRTVYRKGGDQQDYFKTVVAPVKSKNYT